MYLSLQQKRQIFKSFPELTEYVDKSGRYGYNFEGSKHKRKNIAREFTHTGNGYVFGENLVDFYQLADERGWVNVRDFTATQLRDIVRRAIDSLR